MFELNLSNTFLNKNKLLNERTRQHKIKNCNGQQKIGI